MFKQDLVVRPIRDFVFPIGVVINNRFLLRGTAFFIGDKGFAITASHVIDQLHFDDDKNRYVGSDIVGLFINEAAKWEAVGIIGAEKHPDEDVAIIKMDGAFQSIFQVTPSQENSSCEYDLWGYPERVAHEIRALATNAEEAKHMISPDLIYSRGYIRRRISRSLGSSIYIGRFFYELSAVAGACCSGSPIIARPLVANAPYRVIGVYIGEETAGQPAVGYATRFDDIKSWMPQLTGQLLHHLPAIG
ncbi:hypothetical protein [Methylobacterium sp. Leaf106]|uniref:hypothetical protein n=1 Tax=Methylobacterium sp. Leaf106 TaxID=1736255 RepID=UPI000A903356|nr:hypothetical protein [Methylobacterium sp. Leaf106]